MKDFVKIILESIEQNRERDRDLIIFGIRDVLCEVERLEEQEKEMLEKVKHEVVQF